MRDDWIIDVLTDLQSFATRNGMLESAAHLGEACAIVTSELARAGQVNGIKQTGFYDGQVRESSGGYTAG